tara:strand:- start:101896 stop:102219 length:324 start_codon:yes stop_codon:yes gene_type:complete
MRLFSIKNLGLVALTLSLSINTARALSVAGNVCPKQFVGSIESIAHAGAPFSNHQMKTVNVTVTKIINGKVSKKERFSALIAGNGFQEGDQIKVAMKQDLLCSVRKI